MSTPPDERFYVSFSQRTRQNIMYIILFHDEKFRCRNVHLLASTRSIYLQEIRCYHIHQTTNTGFTCELL